MTITQSPENNYFSSIRIQVERRATETTDMVRICFNFTIYFLNQKKLIISLLRLYSISLFLKEKVGRNYCLIWEK